MEFLQPLIKKMKGVGGSIMKTLQKIPGFDNITKVLNKFGGAGSEGLLKKIGGKAIPIIGGVVNMGFAYDRLSKGDSLGGLIEGTSGILDLIGLIPGGQFGPPISMLMDGYMFARDFVPQIQEGEEAAIKKLGLSGFKSNIDNIFSKLPGIGEIAKMITGGDKMEEGSNTYDKNDKNTITSQKTVSGRFDMETGKAYINNQEVSADEYNKFINLSKKEQIAQYGQGTANNIVSTNNSLSNKVNGVSSSASYEEGSGKEVVIINPKNNPSTTSQSTEEGKVVAIESGSGSGSDATASLYRG
jgi:hypothetical protein